MRRLTCMIDLHTGIKISLTGGANFNVMSNVNKVSKEEIDRFLAGSNPMERVIKIEGDYNTDTMKIYYRDDEGKKRCTSQYYFPMLWAKQSVCRRLYGGDRKKVVEELNRFGIDCKGLRIAADDGTVPPRMESGFRILFQARVPMSYSKFQQFFENGGCPIYPKGKNKDSQSRVKEYICVSPTEQFMISTGIRLFKGYDDYDQLLRVSWDIETTGLDPKVDMVDQIGIRTNRGFEEIIEVDGEGEEKKKLELPAISKSLKIIADIDPDIMTGHNTENFDWDFFDVRSIVHGTTLKDLSAPILKNGSGVFKKKKDQVLKLGGEMEYYKPTVMNGVNITDSIHAVRRAMAIDSNMKSAGLKYVCQYSDIKKPNRVYVPGKLIGTIWRRLDNSFAFNDDDGEWFEVTEKTLAKTYQEFKEEVVEQQRQPTEAEILEKYIEDYIAKHPDEVGEYYRKRDDDCVEFGEWFEYKDIPEDFIKEQHSKTWTETVTVKTPIGPVLPKYQMVGDREKLIDLETKKEYQFVTGRYIVKRYLMDDLYETDKVELRYNQPNFLVSKLLPVSFEKACTMGTAAVWKYIMLAWSYEHGLAIPDLINTKKFTGGLSRLLSVGYVDRIVKLDYNSLYPSIILSYLINSNIDISGVMSSLLEYILTQREHYKDLKGKHGKEAKKLSELLEKDPNRPDANEIKEQIAFHKAEAKKYDKLQLPLKILGNGFFGSYGSGQPFPWSDLICAEQTTCVGRMGLRLMISHFKGIGYIPIVGDTDGFNFQMPKTFRYTEEHPYISNGKGRNSEKGKAYTGVDADVAEFEDLYLCPPYVTGSQKMGLGIDEFCPATINFSRKNYSDLLENGKVKLVGNSIKSKKMPKYIENFLNKALRMLLEGRGHEFIQYYYDYVEKVYNMKIPLREIASIGKIKTTLKEYQEACRQPTAGGQKKARQAWYELALRDNLDVKMGDAVYYINTGTKKNESDVDRKTVFYYIDQTGQRVDTAKNPDGSDKCDRRGNPINLTKYIENQYAAFRKANKDNEDELAKYKGKFAYGLSLYPNLQEEDKITFNCIRLSNDIVDDEEEHYCTGGFEYNRAKYIEALNKKVKPLLVCFDRTMRTCISDKGKEISNILIDNPKNRKFFTEEETKLVSGQPYNTTDQDTYEQLMTIEDKEIKFWLSVNQEPPYCKECGIDWQSVVSDYEQRMKELEREEVAAEVKEYNRILDAFTKEDLDALMEDGTLPAELFRFADEDTTNNTFVSRRFGVVLGNVLDFVEKDFNKNTDEEEDDNGNE